MAGHDPDDGAARGSVPDPLDRLWLHPSELAGRAAAAPQPPPVRRHRSRREWALLAGAGSAGALATMLVLALTGTLGTTRDRVSTPISPAPSNEELAARVAAQVAPSVVAIRVTGPSGRREGLGVCIRSGYVLTSDDLLGDGNAITIVTAQGSAMTATAAGRDPLTELALLRADGLSHAARLAPVDTLRVGQVVVEVAAPRDARHWVSVGVVSSINEIAESPSGEMLVGLIETDEHSAPAGAALVDRDGAIVGIVTARADSERATVAMPMSTAMGVVDDLLAKGHVAHGWLGVAATDMTGTGARVEQVMPLGPAASSSLQGGDVIVAIDGEQIDGMATLLAVVRRHRAGQRIELALRRGSSTERIAVVLGEHATTATPPGGS